ncbi:MAG TPA: hypothetical protein VGE74_20565 [Gemmata sp.]
MSFLSRIRETLGSGPRHHKALGHAQAADGSPDDRPTITVEVWVLVDSEGRYVADADPENLSDEYAFQVGKMTLGKPVQLVRLTASLALPRQIELTAVAAE